MLKTMAATKAGRQAGAVLLLVGMSVGAVGAQFTDALFRTGIIATSLFRVNDGEIAEFNVTLEDRADGPNSTVAMKFLDPTGAVVARRAVSLAPGQSATLRQPAAGRYRVQAEVFDPSGVLTDRRAVVSTVEVSRSVGDLTLNRFICGPGDNIEVPIR